MSEDPQGVMPDEYSTHLGFRTLLCLKHIFLFHSCLSGPKQHCFLIHQWIQMVVVQSRSAHAKSGIVGDIGSW